MSRAAPSLNMFAVGLSDYFVFGVVIVLLGLPAVQASFISLFANALDFVGALSAGPEPWRKRRTGSDGAGHTETAGGSSPSWRRPALA